MSSGALPVMILPSACVYVAGQEQIDLTKGAAHILAVQADGGMRDALSMLDQCVSNTSGTIDEGVVRDLLGLIGKDWLFSLAQAIFDGKGDVIIKAVDDVIHMARSRGHPDGIAGPSAGCHALSGCAFVGYPFSL